MKILAGTITALLLFAGMLYADGSKTFSNNNLEITVTKGEAYAPFKAGKGFWTFKVNARNTNAEQGRTLNAKLVLTSGGKQIGECQVYVAVDAGATESADVNCKHMAENIEDFDLKITKVYNKKM